MNSHQPFHNRKFICFVQDHHNPLNVIRSLGEQSINPDVILVSERPCLINHCKYVKNLHIVKTIEDGYHILLERYGREVMKPFIYCSDDKVMSFLDMHYNTLIDKFIIFNAEEQGRITWLQNKDNITNLGIDMGLNCPPKEVVNTGALPNTLRFPIMTKALASTMGAWKDDVFICKNEEELREAYKQIKSPKLILQEYINKTGEFCMEGFAINNGNDIFIPYVIEFIRFYHNSYGHYMRIAPFTDNELKSKIQELLKKTKYNGIFEIEFMKDGDKTYFLEINFRTSPWHYALTYGGGNLPYFWAKSTHIGRIPYEEIILKTQPFNAMLEPADFIRNVKRIGVWQWMKDWISTDCYYYYNRKDPSPFWHYLLSRIFKRRIND